MCSHDRERHPFVLPFDHAEIIPIPRSGRLEEAAGRRRWRPRCVRETSS